MQEELALPPPRALFASLLAAGSALCPLRATAQTPSLLPVAPPPQPIQSPQPQAPQPQVPQPEPTSPAPELPPNPPISPSTPTSIFPDDPLPASQDVVAAAHFAFRATGDPAPSNVDGASPLARVNLDPGPYTRMQQRRTLLLSDQRFLNQEVSIPLNSPQKAFLAATDIADPGNLAVIAVSSAIYTFANPSSAYGPGVSGFGRNYGYALAQDCTAELLGTWLIPSIARQDPRYDRMPGAPTGRRILHALAHTVVTQHDDGSTMPNYATLLTYPISAEIANLYVPGLHTSSASTAKRVVIGLASDPADALIGEFLPDLARRIHIRVTFFQQIINNINADHPL